MMGWMDELLGVVNLHEPEILGHCETELVIGCDSCDWRQEVGGPSWADHIRAAAEIPEYIPDFEAGRPDGFTFVDVPVVDGYATLPDGRVVASTSDIVRVAVRN